MVRSELQAKRVGDDESNESDGSCERGDDAGQERAGDVAEDCVSGSRKAARGRPFLADCEQLPLAGARDDEETNWDHTEGEPYKRGIFDSVESAHQPSRDCE